MEKELLDYMKQVTDYYTKSNVFSADEVVDMFLEKEKVESQNAGSQTGEHAQAVPVGDMGQFSMDLDELEKWRKKNNNKFAIRASLPITSHRRILGKFIVVGKRIARRCLKWYIDPIVEQQNEFNGSLTASINCIYNDDVVANQFIQQAKAEFATQQGYLQKQAQELSAAFNEIQNLTGAIEALRQEVGRVKEEHQEEIEALKSDYETTIKAQEERLEEEVSKHQAAIEQLSSELNSVSRELNGVISEQMTVKEAEIQKLNIQMTAEKAANMQRINTVQDLVEKTEENINYLTYKFNKARKEGIKVELVKAKEKIEEEKLEVKDKVELDYFLFENKFRGTEKSIKKNQERYLPYFAHKENILDIGCGRGEFLELLNEHNIPAKGVDIYDEFVDYCKDKGLQAKEDDALNYVREQKDSSIDGIFMSQVAEHLDNDYLLNLLAACHQKMENGSYFIAETPNPTNLTTFTSSFYLDPSHVKPVHPETFKFMLEYVGFKEVEIVYTDCSKSGYRLPLLNIAGVDNLEEINSGINCVSDILMGSMDYAIIAKK